MSDVYRLRDVYLETSCPLEPGEEWRERIADVRRLALAKADALAKKRRVRRYIVVEQTIGGDAEKVTLRGRLAEWVG